MANDNLPALPLVDENINPNKNEPADGGVAAAGRGGAGGRAGRGSGRGGAGAGGRGGRGGGATGGGRQQGRANYTRNELMRMLETAADVLPISGTEWDMVAATHYSYFPDLERSGDQLKKRFTKMYKTTILRMRRGDTRDCTLLAKASSGGYAAA
jgi:hypothetical protein